MHRNDKQQHTQNPAGAVCAGRIASTHDMPLMRGPSTLQLHVGRRWTALPGSHVI